MSLLSFRAGRCQRRAEGQKWVDPLPAKGLVSLSMDDGLLSFSWTNLETNDVEESLILFPGDATFTSVPAAPRVYVLRFTSSSARHFYWMQDVSPDEDARRAARVNQVIDDPESSAEEPQGQQGTEGDSQMSSAPAATTSSSGPAPSSSTQPQDRDSASAPIDASSLSASMPGVTPSQMAQLQALLSQAGSAQHGGIAPSSSSLHPDVSLADILSPSRLLSLLSSPNAESIAEALYPFLPSDTRTVPHTLESLRQVVTSPELRKSARSLDQAFTTGALGPLASSLGLREDETFGVQAYINGVQRLADEEKQKQGGSESSSRGSMQTD